MEPCATSRRSSMACSTSPSRRSSRLAVLGGDELLAGEREVDAQRDEPLLRGVVEVALDPAPLDLAGLEARARATPAARPRGRRSRPPRASPSRRRARARGPRRASRRRPSRRPAAVLLDRHPRAARLGRRGLQRASRRARGRSPSRGRGSPAAARRRRAPSRSRRATAPASAAPTAARSSATQRLGREAVGLQQRDEEAERQQDPRADDRPRQRVERLRVGVQDPARRS